MKSRFYHQPSPWNPGYAIPEYVLAEPLERGTFTTQWLPRGTIPEVLPDYLARSVGARRVCSLSESSLSTSSLTGNSLAGSSLAGDSLGAQYYELEPLGSNAPARYGKLAAKAMIARIKQLPQNKRGPALKEALKQLDPTLPKRCQKYADALQKSGVPAPQALEAGIARAMSEGASAQLSRMGAGRAVPQSRSLRGLGRSHMALGADPLMAIPMMNLLTPQDGDCDATGQYIFRSGAWLRKKAGEACGRMSSATATQSSSGIPTVTASINIGPFGFPTSGAQSVSWTTPIGAYVKYFSAKLGALIRAYGQTGMPLHQNTTVDGALFGMPGTKIKLPTKLVTGKMAIQEAEGRGGKRWAVFLTDVDKRGPGSGTVVLRAADADDSWYEDAWNAVKDAVKTAVSLPVNIVKEAVGVAKDVACSVLGQPQATQAAIASGQLHLAAGTTVAASLCPQPGGAAPAVDPAMMQPVESGSGWMLPVAIGAGGLVLLAVLARR